MTRAHLGRCDLVSVVIPNFNCARWLPAVVDSCVMQGDRLGEIIVVDDGSTDGSLKVLERIRSELPPGLLQIFRNPGKGANDARNYGFAQSSGAFIQWLDADDFLLPGKFDRQIAAFLEQPEADVIYSDWCEELRDSNGEVCERRIHELRPYGDFARELVADNWSVPASYLFRRPMAERLHELRAWNPRTRVAQDREYMTVAALIGAGFGYAPGIFSIYNRWNPNSTSSMPFKERLGHQLELELRFRDLILSSNLSSKKRKEYISLLNAHALNACYYNPALTIRQPFWIGGVDLSIIHYKKYPVLPAIYAWQMARWAWANAWRRGRRAPAGALQAGNAAASCRANGDEAMGLE